MASDRASPLHLLWAAPLAALVGCSLLAEVLGRWCGRTINVCQDVNPSDGFDFLSNVGCLLIPAAIVGVILGLAPWCADRRLGWSVAGGAAVLVVVSGIAYMAFG